MAVLKLRDVARLIKEPSPRVRAETAAKIGAEFSSGRMDPSARAIAEEIFRVMLQDAELRVRKELSESLKSCPQVPRDVAVARRHRAHDSATGRIGCARKRGPPRGMDSSFG